MMELWKLGEFEFMTTHFVDLCRKIVWTTFLVNLHLLDSFCFSASVGRIPKVYLYSS